MIREEVLFERWSAKGKEFCPERLRECDGTYALGLNGKYSARDFDHCKLGD
jgi:hypothetical protein